MAIPIIRSSTTRSQYPYQTTSPKEPEQLVAVNINASWDSAPPRTSTNTAFSQEHSETGMRSPKALLNCSLLSSSREPSKPFKITAMDFYLHYNSTEYMYIHRTQLSEHLAQAASTVGRLSSQLGPKPTRPKTKSAQNQLGPKLTRPRTTRSFSSLLLFSSSSSFFFFLLPSFVLCTGNLFPLQECQSPQGQTKKFWKSGVL